MNIFKKILMGDYQAETRLGCPSNDSAAQKRRLNAMATMTGMRGFSVPPLSPAVHPTFGTTRGQRKRAARQKAMAVECARQRKEVARLVSQGVPEGKAIDGFGCLAGLPI